jgi:hypothetical protein
MAIELQFESIIIPIENINKCKSLGGFEKFIESQKDRIGHDVWYDEYLYRYRVPDGDTEMIFEFWEKEGLQLHNRNTADSENNEWSDLCLADENGPSLKCDWLEVDKDVPCVWLKGKPRGELYGSNRRNSKVISESTIGKEYYVEFFERLYKFQKIISILPEKLRKAYNFRSSVVNFEHRTWEPPKSYLNYLLKPFLYIIQLILFLFACLKIMVLPKFDANKFFEIFNLISLDKGYILDYQYCGDCPAVYTRNKLYLLHLFNYMRKYMNDRYVLGPFKFEDIENVSFEQSPEGFFQFAVFSRAVHQFYLYWHAVQNDSVFIYSRSQIDEILKTIIKEQYEYAIRQKMTDYLSSREIKEKANQELSVLFNNRKSDEDISIYLGPLMEEEQTAAVTGEKSIIQWYWTTEEELNELFSASLHPEVIIMENGYGIVKMLSFSKWSGFAYHYSYIKWPNVVEKVRTERVLLYSCGIQF